MRSLGIIHGRKQAESFVAFLLTQDVSTHIEATDADEKSWEIWVRDEDKLALASTELTAFQQNPNDPKYAHAIDKAGQLLDAKRKAQEKAARNVRRMETRSTFSSRGPMPPLTLTLLILSILVSLLNKFGRPSENNEWGQAINRQLSFVADEDLQRSNGDPAASLRRGQVWRAITPIFLHGDMFHLAMNMFVLVSFGRIVERIIGTPKFALFVLLLAVVPNLFQGLMPEALHGSPRFGGMSGVLYGFLGYMWIRSSLNPMMGFTIPMPFLVLAIGLIVVGLLGIVPNWPFADLCHLGGLMVGAAMGFASEQAGARN